jgi:hypothetical protein
MCISFHRGANRWVICNKSYAFKFPSPVSYISFLSGLRANVVEVGNFNYAKRGIFPLEKLCPICFFIPFGLFIVMKKAKILTDKEFENFDCVAFCDLGNATLPVEQKPDSFGYLNNQIVATDYE